jgi:membrane-bound lytic murein transglycosylase D
MKSALQPIFNFTSGFLICLLIILQSSFNNDKEVKATGPEFKTHQWYAPAIPEKMNFAEERVPLDQWDVKERLDRELLFNYYWQNNILYILKLANRFFPVIEERLTANGVPRDFKYLCVAESNLVANATSRAGAVGFWQFMSGTAPGYELEVNKRVDERRHIIESTDAACKYLKAAYAKFGSWTAAAASYNCGQGGYATQANMQKTNNYYDLFLPEETSRYIFRILAFKHLIENASDLGFILQDNEFYHPIKTRTVRVTSSIDDLSQFAINNGTNYKILRTLNPWLRSNSLVVKPGKGYEILLPR